ncbi:MAG TPA: FAD-binding protein [Rhodanobacter sp.]|nr:FAD-binding protein [Rhodanobacter sp.]
MKRRELLKAMATLPLLPLLMRSGMATAREAAIVMAAKFRSRVRPGDPGWPLTAQWEQLKRDVGGRLLKLESPFARCATSPSDGACAETLKRIDNPYALGDEPALTQTSGWADAWTSQPSAYAVAAENTADVVAAINFARQHHLRLVVKGGGHSYQGTSDAPDSLLVWTRHMNKVTLHDAFVAQGCTGQEVPQPAVTIEAGAMWSDAYDAVTTKGGRYVQGGGGTTVGVAGLVQSGGFGNFSKNWGTAAANLLEAEIVTADGEVRITNACTHPDLFWGIKGGGGGSLGTITRLTLRTFELPDMFGAVFGAIQASSDDAFRTLIAKAMDFYRSALFNPHWGEQISFRGSNTLNISMVFQGLTQQQAEQAWAPFLDWVRARSEYRFTKPMQTLSLPARHLWDADFYRAHAPQLIVADDRPGAPDHHTLWAGDQDQVGWFIHGYQSAWLPAALLQPSQQSRLADALFAASRHWGFSLHFNKGLAGGSVDAIERSRDTATHPQMLDAFALAICASSGDPAFPGMPNARPELARARHEAATIDKAMNALRAVAPGAGTYVSESDYFLHDWQQGFWGSHYAKLAAVKRKYDPDGLFFVHHGVGSEAWSADGFTRLT